MLFPQTVLDIILFLSGTSIAIDNIGSKNLQYKWHRYDTKQKAIEKLKKCFIRYRYSFDGYSCQYVTNSGLYISVSYDIYTEDTSNGTLNIILYAYNTCNKNQFFINVSTNGKREMGNFSNSKHYISYGQIRGHLMDPFSYRRYYMFEDILQNVKKID